MYLTHRSRHRRNGPQHSPSHSLGVLSVELLKKNTSAGEEMTLQFYISKHQKLLHRLSK
jgi:hypothetical protein